MCWHIFTEHWQQCSAKMLDYTEDYPGWAGRCLENRWIGDEPVGVRKLFVVEL